MKQIYILCLVLLALLASCRKESDTVTLGATIENINGNPKLYIDNFTPQWESDDPVWINDNGNYSITFSGAAAQIANVTRTSDNHYLAIYPTEIANSCSNGTANITLLREQVYQYDNDNDRQQVKVPMIAYTTTGQTLSFKNLCSLLKVTVSNSTGNDIILKRITLTASNNYLSGPVTASIQDGEGHLSTWGDEAEHDVSLVFNNTETVGSTAKEYYIAVPEFTGNDEVSIIVYTDNGEFFPLLKSSVPLAHNTIASVTVNITQLQTPHHAFSVDGTHQVYFSKGNLQYTIQETHTTADNNYTTGTWRFAKHQYDIIGTNNNQISNTNYTGWIDLFGWATSGYNGKAPTLADFDYTHYFYTKNITGSYSFYDWGQYNSIDGDQYGTWRTLTSSEWNYLLESRTGILGTNARFAEVAVNGIHGVILLPDGFTWPSTGITQPSLYNNYHSTWNNIDYTPAKWAILETAGIIFLPAAGYRYVTTTETAVSNVNNAAFYWSSTKNKTESYANNIMFDNRTASYNGGRRFVYEGLSVRLVRDVSSSR